MAQKALIVEFIGTFFLVLTIGLASNPIAIGAVLAAMVYMGGYISGGHYNPAVTLALRMRGAIDRELVLKYWAAQLLGALVASLIYFVIKNGAYLPVGPNVRVSFLAALLVEVIFTFALASVVLHVATTPEVKNNDYYGLAIGLVLIASIYAGGSISGAAFNPAVGWGPNLFNVTHLGDHLDNLALYALGPLVGGALAAWVYQKVLPQRA